MLVAVLVWLCLLPLIALGVAPIVGGWAAVVMAGALLPVIIAVCGRLYGPSVAKEAEIGHTEKR